MLAGPAKGGVKQRGLPSLARRPFLLRASHYEAPANVAAQAG